MCSQSGGDLPIDNVGRGIRLVEMEDSVTLTRHHVQAMMTKRGGFTRKTIEALGIDFRNPPKGWAKALIGKTVPLEVYTAAVEGAGIFRPKRQRKKADAAPAPVVHEATHFISKRDRDELFDSFIWKTVRAALLRDANFTCQYCGQRAPHVQLQVDHIVPITKDWSRRLDILNLQVLCAQCNSGKSNFFS